MARQSRREFFVFIVGARHRKRSHFRKRAEFFQHFRGIAFELRFRRFFGTEDFVDPIFHGGLRANQRWRTHLS